MEDSEVSEEDKKVNFNVDLINLADENYYAALLKQDDFQYNILDLEDHARILNKTTPEEILKLHKGPFYERFPRGLYEEDMEMLRPAFNRIYPLGYQGGPYSIDQSAEIDRRRYFPSEPDYNVFYEETYGFALNEMKMIEAMNRRRNNLIYDEPNFTIDIVDSEDNILRELVINREMLIKDFLKKILGKGDRYTVEIVFCEEINKSVTDPENRWYNIETVVDNLSNVYDQNVYITFKYPSKRFGKTIKPVSFNKTTKTKDVFDISMPENNYMNFFMIRDIPPVKSDISSKFIFKRQ